MMGRAQLIEETIRKNLGTLCETGALMVDTGSYTGRCVNRRFVVETASTKCQINWGAVNVAYSEERFQRLEKALSKKLENDSYAYEGYVGPFPIRVRTFSPWHLLFAKNMFRENPVQIGLPASTLGKIEILHDPFGKLSDYGIDDGHETIIVLNPETLTVCIVGTAYAGEIKKSAFTLCNFRLPEFGVLPMHASANCTEDGKHSSVLFGLSGTGKTTLSASHDRYLIGDDEIVWSPLGLANLEGGCYAKLIDLDPEKEPEIFKAVNQFGSIMENVGFDKETRKVDYASRERTENSRGSYSIDKIPQCYNQSKLAGHPDSVIFLTADAFGAMPAVARLNHHQLQYHFVSGYTAKVAGTEIGVTEPKATFSACFGAPFMPRFPSVYAGLLAKYVATQGSQIWILNTGWTGGKYGIGHRFPISVSRAILSAIQNGTLNEAPMKKHPQFGFEVPTSCPGVDPKWLAIPDGDEVKDLAGRFHQNIMLQKSQLPSDVLSFGGP